MGEVVFFVSNTGSDQWSGIPREPDRANRDGPFATLAGARDAVRALKREGPLKQPVSIMVRGGVYRFSEPFCLGPEDSGTTDASITYRAYPGETPILSGGVSITDWRPSEGPLWRASLSDTSVPGAGFRQLFVNGSRRCRARLPADGRTYEIAGVLDPDQPLNEELGENCGKSNDNHTGFRFQPGQIKNGDDLADLEVVVFHPFATTRTKIAELDEGSGIVRFSGPQYIWSYAPPKRYYLENTRAGLAVPGTWHLDCRAGVVTYHPFPDEDMRAAEVVAPVLSSLIRIEGDPRRDRLVKHVTIRGFTLRHADWELTDGGFRDPQAATVIPGAVWAQGAVDCAVEDNVIEKVGTYALELGRGCRNNRVVGNRMHDLGAGGIKVGETVNRPDDADETRGTVVTDNTIYDGGKVFPEGVSIWIGQSSGNIVAHNEIYDMPYTGISVGWNWGFSRNRTRDNIVEFNHIHHVMQGELDDGGAIYHLGISPGNVIRNNVIHHVYGRTYAYGIYLDEGSMGVLVENNIVHHFSGAGIRLQIATGGNMIVNNIIALGTQAQFGIDTDRANCYLCNIVYWTEGKLFTRDSWNGCETVFDHNLYFDASGRTIDFAGHTFEQWKRLRPKSIRYVRPDPVDGRALVADPLFADPQRGDFSLSPQSPALTLGFKPIDVSAVGPRIRAGTTPKGDRHHSSPRTTRPRDRVATPLATK